MVTQASSPGGASPVASQARQPRRARDHGHHAEIVTGRSWFREAEAGELPLPGPFALAIEVNHEVVDRLALRRGGLADLDAAPFVGGSGDGTVAPSSGSGRDPEVHRSA